MTPVSALFATWGVFLVTMLLAECPAAGNGEVEPVSSPAGDHTQTERAMRIGEEEFRLRLAEELRSWSGYGCVTGPGRSGAIASVYASHETGLPWIPFGTRVPESLWPVLVVDTAAKSGRTLRRAIKLHGPSASGFAVYSEPPRLRFWYEK